MPRSFRLRRCVLAAALAMPALLAAAPTGAHASPVERTPRTISNQICNFDWSRSTRQVKLLIGCAARRWEVPGGPAKALDVARCESGYQPDAYNPGGFAGVYQHPVRYWRLRANRYGFPGRSVFNGRANIIVAIRLAHSAHSWSDWSCA
jgi:hypothetical protein